MANIIFAGTPEIAVPSLQALHRQGHNILCVLTQPDKAAGRGQHIHTSPIKQAAEALDLPIAQPVSLKDPAEQKTLIDLQADIMIVAAYGLMLPDNLINNIKRGAINIHMSLLPRWRGASPIQQAILAGDKETGVSIMQIVKALDAGDVYTQTTTAIQDNDTAGSLHDRLALLGATTLCQTLPDILQATTVPQKQDEKLVTWAPKISKADGRLDWNKSAIELARQIRAFNPWPVAHCLWANKSLRIWNATASGCNQSLPPGTIVADTSTLNIACGEGTLSIHQLQPAGKKIMSAQDFINGNKKNLLIDCSFT